MKELEKDLKYLRQLAKQFPSSASVASEIMNLQAILNLPKGTEHFLADVHGEYEAFAHVLKNASGTIRTKVYDLFGGQVRDSELKELCTLIYYPRATMELIRKREDSMTDWFKVALNQLIKVCQRVSEKYTRSKVRKALPEQYSYIIQELLHEDNLNAKKSAYFQSILDSIIETGRAEDVIAALCLTIQQLAIDHLHVVGDIYDRGPGAHIIMDRLLKYHHVDIQWGNHDMLWMGAAVGNVACIANVIRIALRYANLETIEDGYGINLFPLARLATDIYADDPCLKFQPKFTDTEETYDDRNIYLISQMHKAIAIIQFKLEAQLIDAHPEYQMEDRKLLHLIDKERKTITLPNGEKHSLLDNNFPTIDPEHPYQLTDEEQEVVNRLTYAFAHSDKLREHIDFLYAKGGMYLAYNSNLLFHAAIPLNENKEVKAVRVGKKYYAGKALMERIDSYVRQAHWSAKDVAEHQDAIDFIWYLWCGPDSPLFDKKAMTTFERYFLEDKKMHKEAKGYYYQFREEQAVCEYILREFGLDPSESRIINGHVPVKASKGESPMQANGKLMLIDGGFSRAYQSSTGIAGYTLIFNSQGLHLVKHEPFSSTKQAIEQMEDIKSVSVVREFSKKRILVMNTDKGKLIKEEVEDLKKLLKAYRLGLIKEVG